VTRNLGRGGDEVSSRLYTDEHYQAFLSRLTKQHISVLMVITENSYISKTEIIEKLSGEYSKNPIVAAIDALLFAGLITYRYREKQHQYYLSEDGIAFNEYANKKIQEESNHGTL
jgi:hypothetical protein